MYVEQKGKKGSSFYCCYTTLQTKTEKNHKEKNHKETNKKKKLGLENK